MQEVKEAKVELKEGKLGHTADLRFDFGFEVKTAIVIMNGFELKYEPGDHNVRKISARVANPDIKGNTVTSSCLYEMYDNSGNAAGGVFYASCYAWDHVL